MNYRVSINGYTVSTNYYKMPGYWMTCIFRDNNPSKLIFPCYYLDELSAEQGHKVWTLMTYIHPVKIYNIFTNECEEI